LSCLFVGMTGLRSEFQRVFGAKLPAWSVERHGETYVSPRPDLTKPADSTSPAATCPANTLPRRQAVIRATPQLKRRRDV
jgi:hypothetical protein